MGSDGHAVPCYAGKLKHAPPKHRGCGVRRTIEKENARYRYALVIDCIGTRSGDPGFGGCAFNQALFDLVKAGRVTEKEAMSKASNPQALEMNFKGIFLDEGRRIISS